MPFYRWEDYQCANFGHCSQADTQEIIDLPLGAEPLCPECQKPLIPMRRREIVLVSPPVTSATSPQGRKRAPSWLLIPIAITLLIFGLTAGVVWPLMRTPEHLYLKVPTQVTARVGDTLQIPIAMEPGSAANLTLTVEGSLPPGVSLDVSGRRLYGTAQSAGAYWIVVTARAPRLASASAAMGIRIERNPAPAAALALQASPHIEGRVGDVLEVPLAVVPASAPDTTLTVQGNLPRGVTLDTAGKRLFGSPQSSGSYAVVIGASAPGYTPALVAVDLSILDAKPSPPPAETYDLVLTGSDTIGGVDPSSRKGLTRDLVTEFCKMEWPGGTLENEELKDIGQDEKDRLITYRLPAGESRRIVIRPHGSKTAVDALKSTDPNRQADVGMSSSKRPELQQGFSESIIALDAVAVVVHPDNPVREFTLEQLRNIFGPNPTVTRWEDGNPIQTYGRDKKSGTTECFRAVTGIDRALEALQRSKDDSIPYTGVPDGQEGHEGYEDASKIIERVSANRYAIGYVGRAANLPISVRAVAIRPEPGYSAFVPNAATIRTMDYCLARELFLYTLTNPRPLASDFVRFCLGEDGQKVVDDDGFISFRAENLLGPPLLGDRAPQTLRKAVVNCDRVVISFRFRKGDSDTIDAISTQKLKRLVDFLRRPELSNRHLTIVGFADNSSTRSQSYLDARKRAESFATLLENAGIENPIDQKLGFGRDYLLYGGKGDPNPREAQRNRRVDVYLKR